RHAGGGHPGPLRGRRGGRRLQQARSRQGPRAWLHRRNVRGGGAGGVASERALPTSPKRSAHVNANDERPEPHARNIVVWDVPDAVERGETFRVKVGVKCSAECVPDTWVFGVRDHEGRVLASRRVGTEPWPGTAALFHAEAEL